MTSNKKEVVGNYEVNDSEVVTRRDVLLMGAVAAGSLVAAAPVFAEPQPTTIAAAAKGVEAYVAKDFSHLVGKKMAGLSDSQIEQHLKLYKAYIGKANALNEKLKSPDMAGSNPTYSPFREMLIEESYAVNGVIYHELYFGNLGGKGGEPTGDLKAALDERWGSSGKFIDYLKNAGKCMRGWVVVGHNTRGNHLSAFGLDMHNMFAPANVVPLLVLDVYEHAYMVDYGIDRGKYLDAFVNNLDWNTVTKRFTTSRNHPSGADSTT